MHCGENKFCLGFEENKVYCYGNNNGCLWGQNTCNTNDDCKKYTKNSLKYTDGDIVTCPANANGWRKDACSPVLINGTDIADMIQGGTYTTKKTIQGLTGFPSGKVPSSSFVYPKPFGIVVNGVDICNQYEALYVDHTINSTGNFPTWCKSYKVICIGGGSGASGGTASYMRPNLTIVMPKPGYKGSNGNITVESGIKTIAAAYTVIIGKGGSGGEPGLLNGQSGTSGQPGEPTSFSYDNNIIKTVSGKYDNTYGPITSTSIKHAPYVYGEGGKGEIGKGYTGTSGVCRVYFYG